MTTATLEVVSTVVPASANGVETQRLGFGPGTQTYFSTIVPADAINLAFLLYGGTGTMRT